MLQEEGLALILYLLLDDHCVLEVVDGPGVGVEFLGVVAQDYDEGVKVVEVLFVQVEGGVGDVDAPSDGDFVQGPLNSFSELFSRLKHRDSCFPLPSLRGQKQYP